MTNRTINGIRILGHGIFELTELQEYLFPLLEKMIFNGGGDTNCFIVGAQYKELSELYEIYTSIFNTKEKTIGENYICFYLGSQDSMIFRSEDLNTKDIPGDIVVKLDSYLESYEKGKCVLVEETHYV